MAGPTIEKSRRPRRVVEGGKMSGNTQNVSKAFSEVLRNRGDSLMNNVNNVSRSASNMAKNVASAKQRINDRSTKQRIDDRNSSTRNELEKAFRNQKSKKY